MQVLWWVVLCLAPGDDYGHQGIAPGLVARDARGNESHCVDVKGAESVNWGGSAHSSQSWCLPGHIVAHTHAHADARKHTHTDTLAVCVYVFHLPLAASLLPCGSNNQTDSHTRCSPSCRQSAATQTLTLVSHACKRRQFHSHTYSHTKTHRPIAHTHFLPCMLILHRWHRWQVGQGVRSKTILLVFVTETCKKMFHFNLTLFQIFLLSWWNMIELDHYTYYLNKQIKIITL